MISSSWCNILFISSILLIWFRLLRCEVIELTDSKYVMNSKINLVTHRSIADDYTYTTSHDLDLLSTGKRGPDKFLIRRNLTTAYVKITLPDQFVYLNDSRVNKFSNFNQSEMTPTVYVIIKNHNSTYRMMFDNFVLDDSNEVFVGTFDGSMLEIDRCLRLSGAVFLGASPPLQYFTSPVIPVYEDKEPLLMKLWGTLTNESSVETDLINRGVQQNAVLSSDNSEAALNVIVVRGVSSLYLGVTWAGFLPDTTTWWDLNLDCFATKVFVTHDYIVLETSDCGLMRSSNYSDPSTWSTLNTWTNIYGDSSSTSWYNVATSSLRIVNRNKCDSIENSIVGRFPELVFTLLIDNTLYYTFENYQWTELTFSDQMKRDYDNDFSSCYLHVFNPWSQSIIAAYNRGDGWDLIEYLIHQNKTLYKLSPHAVIPLSYELQKIIPLEAGYGPCLVGRTKVLVLTDSLPETVVNLLNDTVHDVIYSKFLNTIIVQTVSGKVYMKKRGSGSVMLEEEVPSSSVILNSGSFFSSLRFNATNSPILDANLLSMKLASIQEDIIYSPMNNFEALLISTDETLNEQKMTTVLGNVVSFQNTNGSNLFDVLSVTNGEGWSNIRSVLETKAPRPLPYLIPGFQNSALRLWLNGTINIGSLDGPAEIELLDTSSGDFSVVSEKSLFFLQLRNSTTSSLWKSPAYVYNCSSTTVCAVLLLHYPRYPFDSNGFLDVTEWWLSNTVLDSSNTFDESKMYRNSLPSCNAYYNLGRIERVVTEADMSINFDVDIARTEVTVSGLNDRQNTVFTIDDEIYPNIYTTHDDLEYGTMVFDNHELKPSLSQWDIRFSAYQYGIPLKKPGRPVIIRFGGYPEDRLCQNRLEELDVLPFFNQLDDKTLKLAMYPDCDSTDTMEFIVPYSLQAIHYEVEDISGFVDLDGLEIVHKIPVNYRPPGKSGVARPSSFRVYNADPTQNITVNLGVHPQFQACEGKESREDCDCTPSQQRSERGVHSDCISRVVRMSYPAQFPVKVNFTNENTSPKVAEKGTFFLHRRN